jgi:hypothetical protein
MSNINENIKTGNLNSKKYYIYIVIVILLTFIISIIIAYTNSLSRKHYLIYIAPVICSIVIILCLKYILRLKLNINKEDIPRDLWYLRIMEQFIPGSVVSVFILCFCCFGAYALSISGENYLSNAYNNKGELEYAKTFTLAKINTGSICRYENGVKVSEHQYNNYKQNEVNSTTDVKLLTKKYDDNITTAEINNVKLTVQKDNIYILEFDLNLSEYPSERDNNTDNDNYLYELQACCTCSSDNKSQLIINDNENGGKQNLCGKYSPDKEYKVKWPNCWNEVDLIELDSITSVNVKYILGERYCIDTGEKPLIVKEKDGRQRSIFDIIKPKTEK